MKNTIQIFTLLLLSFGMATAQDGVHNFFSTAIDDDLTDAQANPINCRDMFQLDFTVGLTTNSDYVQGADGNPAVQYEICLSNLMPASFDGGDPLADLTLGLDWGPSFTVVWDQTSATTGCYLLTQNPGTTLPGFAIFTLHGIQFELDVVVPDVTSETFTSEMSGTWITLPSESANGSSDNQDQITYNGECDQALLPVDWVSFDASPDHGKSYLDWTVANQYNSSHFEIERSSDGQFFKPIGKVSTVDLADEQLNYDFYDVEPMKSENYYRLRHVDLDGSATFSNIQVVTFDSKAGDYSMTIYPNPAADHVNLDLEFVPTGSFETSVELIDALGRTVKTYNLGSDHSIQIPLDISNLSSGLYTFKVENEERILTRKLEILN